MEKKNFSKSKYFGEIEMYSFGKLGSCKVRNELDFYEIFLLEVFCVKIMCFFLSRVG